MQEAIRLYETNKEAELTVHGKEKANIINLFKCLLIEARILKSAGMPILAF